MKCGPLSGSACTSFLGKATGATSLLVPWSDVPAASLNFEDEPFSAVKVANLLRRLGWSSAPICTPAMW